MSKKYFNVKHKSPLYMGITTQSIMLCFSGVMFAIIIIGFARSSEYAQAFSGIIKTGTLVTIIEVVLVIYLLFTIIFGAFQITLIVYGAKMLSQKSLFKLTFFAVLSIVVGAFYFVAAIIMFYSAVAFLIDILWGLICLTTCGLSIASGVWFLCIDSTKKPKEEELKEAQAIDKIEAKDS